MKLTRLYCSVLALQIGTPFVVFANPEPEPVYASVELDALPYEGEYCEGGDWSLRWKGPVHVEGGPLADLLSSYTAIDTSHPGQRAIPPVSFQSKQVTCRDNAGEVVMRANVTPQHSTKVQLTVSLASNAAAHSPAFIFSADELGVCRIDYAGASFEQPNILTSIHTGLQNRLQHALDISLEDLQQGFNKTYQFDGTVAGVAPLCMGSQLARGSVNLRYKSADEAPDVALNACLHLAKDEVRTIIAQGTPAKGDYRFSSRPGNVLAIASQHNNNAQIRGTTPGTGDVSVDYTLKGKTASTTVAGSVVDLVNINHAAQIPKLGIYDAEGREKSTPYGFPLSLNPVDGFVQMTLADDTLASVTNTARAMHIQPVKTGKTILQAKTLCGTDIGKPITIEIVRCDDAVQEKLRAKRDEYKQRADAIVKRITGLTGDTEFQRASTEIADTTKEMAIKTGESIVNTLSFGETQKVKFATKKGIQLSEHLIVNSQRLSVAGTLWDSRNAVNDAKAAFAAPNNTIAQAKFYIGTAVLVAQNQAIALGKTYGEAYLAAEKFGRDLGLIAGVVDQLAELEPQHSKIIKEYIQVSDRLAFCEKTTPAQQDNPQPAPVKEQENKDTEEPLPAEEIPVEPEPQDTPEPEEQPTPPEELPAKKVYGLACRIQDLKMPGLALQLGKLEQLVHVQQQTLSQAKADLQQWQAAIDAMIIKNEGSAAERGAEFTNFIKAQEQFLLKSAQSGSNKLNYLMDTEECAEQLELKFDQIRTRYN